MMSRYKYVIQFLQLHEGSGKGCNLSQRNNLRQIVGKLKYPTLGRQTSMYQ